MNPRRTRILPTTLITCALAAAASACDATSEKPTDCAASRSEAGSGDESPAQTAVPPDRIECTFVFRESNEVGEGDDPADPKFEFEERTLTVAKNEDASETLGKLSLNLSYSVDQHEGSGASLTVSNGDQQVFHALYQIGSRGLINQFAGDHGFTGLIYLTHPTEGGDYQLICKAK